MKSRSPHMVILGIIAVMTLSSSCATEEFQRFREKVDGAFDTANKGMETVQQGAKTAECIKHSAVCPAKDK